MDKLKANQYYCTYHKHANGMGGVAKTIDDTKISINILEHSENFALNHDEVIVEQDNEKSGILYGKIVTIIKHNTSHLAGVIYPHKEQFFLRVTDPKFGHYLVIIKSEIAGKFSRDEVFNSVIISYPSAVQPYFSVELLNRVGEVSEDNIFITNLLKEAHVPVEFSKNTINYVDNLSEKIEESALIDRTDLRSLPFVTIDGADAKDFDDAVYCTIENDVYHLYVAIADVAHYVEANAALDRDAYLRGTSIYFPTEVIPMLPEKLSNGLCSLNPHVDRLVMCCHMQINPQGRIIDYHITNAVIHSKARLTYSQVQTWLNELSVVPEDLLSNISNLYLVYQLLLKQRKERGAIDFNSIEPMFVFDSHGMVCNLETRTRLETHKLIEECMLAANVCVADFLQRHNQPALFRIHEKPTEEKFSLLKEYLHSLAIDFPVAHANLTPQHYAQLLLRIQEHQQLATIEQAVLRSMQLAMYSPHNLGHFGLNYEHYTHFTSPIRRYPDLLTHRALKYVLLGQQYTYPYDLASMGEQTSATERRAEELERKVDSFYKCQFAKRHIGKSYEGVITAVVNFGVFVYIPALMIDGLLHVSELGNDYFLFNEKTQTLVGRNNGFSYRASQNVQVEISGVNLAKLFIDLVIAN